MSSLLTARISVDYPNKPGVLRDVQLDISEGEILGLVGESGSSKSSIALAPLRLLDHKGGSIRGEIRRDLLRLRWAECAGSVDAKSRSCYRVRWLRSTRRCGSGRRSRKRGGRTNPGATAKLWKDQALDLFERVNLPPDDAFLERYPGQLSVGQAQRVLIAMAVPHKPKLLIADEATSRSTRLRSPKF